MARPVGRRGETRERVLPAALELFAEHGISGTSLQMIANRVGLTKAAIYHLFPSKDEIVLAVLQPARDAITEMLELAEAQTDRELQVDTILRGLVQLVVDRGQLTAVLYGDPGATEILRTHPQMQPQIARLTDLLIGPTPSPTDRVAAAMFGGGLMLSGVDPLLADLDDDTLRRGLLASARRLLLPTRD